MLEFLGKNKIDLQILKRIKEAVKNNFEKIDSVFNELNEFPFLKHDIQKRIEKGILFQPGRIVETMVIQSLADQLNCIYTENGQYISERFLLKQDGGSGMPDLIILDKLTGIFHIFEIKEPSAYGKSSGFTYDEHGKPVDFTTKNDEFREYAKSLFLPGGALEHYNILENQGHNKVFSIEDIITNDYDYIISYDEKNGLVKVMSPETYKESYDFRIEVRSCGRNTRKAFTTNLLEIQNDLVKLEESLIATISKRGDGKTSSRYKYVNLGATFSFKKDKIIQTNGKYYVKLKDLSQHVGEISIQHFTKKDA